MNHLATIEYDENGLRFGRIHNKMTNIWTKLHPIGLEEQLAILDDYLTLYSIF